MHTADPPLAKLVTVFATPSQFTNFCFFLVQHLLRVTLRDFDQIVASELEHLKRAWSSRKQANVLLLCDCPERRLVETYLRTQGRALVILDDPLEISTFLASMGSLPPPWAVRTADQTVTTIADLVPRDHALVIERRHQWTASDFLKTVADFFAIEISDAQIEALFNSLLHPPASPDISLEDLYVRNWPAATPLPDQAPTGPFAMFSSLLDQMRRRLTGAAYDAIDWPISMFINTACPDQPFDGSVDLTGPARCVIYGPYLCLPIGRWSLNATIDVCDNFSGNQLSVDVFQGAVLAHKTFTLPSEGHFLLTARFAVTEPRKAIELRFMLLQGAIEGKITLRRVTISPQDS